MKGKKVTTNSKRAKITSRFNSCRKICRKIFIINLAKNKNYCNVRDHWHFIGEQRDATHNICNWRLNVHNEIPLVFHNPSNYDCHFIIKGLANEFEELSECFGEI